MNIKDYLYYLVVERKPGIKREYEAYVNKNMQEHYEHRLKSWNYLMKLHFKYLMTPAGMSGAYNANDLSYPEMGKEERMACDELVGKLAKYDVVSFDIFDTLILRGISDPKNLFVLVGKRLGVTGFKTLRIEAEIDARKRHPEINGEITIEDIYDVLQSRCGLNKKKGIEVELNAELSFCFANPYMKYVTDSLHKKGKKIIATSNMYWKEAEIKKILDNAGYSYIDQIFVSCDYKCSKHKGKLQSVVWEKIGKKNSVIHVGDNYNVDFVGSRMAGWKAYYYKNVNEIGNEYRAKNMSDFMGSVYSGLVNARFHNGTTEQNMYYELGYAYGGPLIAGYCQWLNRYAKNNDIDKLLFSSRDMYTVHIMYNKYFKKYENDYIYISRFAAQRFAYKYYSEYFIMSHVKARAGINKLTIRESLEELEISSLYAKLSDYNLDEDDILDMSNYDSLKKCMEDNKDLLLEEFEDEKKAAIKYYAQFIQKNQKVAVADLGWQGTNALCLKDLIEKDTDLEAQVNSCVIVLKGRRTFADHMQIGNVADSYCANLLYNTPLMHHFITTASLGIFLCEMIFTSPERSLKYFHLAENGEIQMGLMPEEQREDGIFEMMFLGIEDFIKDLKKLNLSDEEEYLTGYEAMLPINKLCYNADYCKEILQAFEVNPWIGETKSKTSGNINKVVR